MQLPPARAPPSAPILQAVARFTNGGDVTMTEDTVYIRPTILCRLERGTLATVTVDADDGRAMIVFRSEEEAERFRAATGQYPESEGFKPVALSHKHLEDVIRMLGCSHVAMPEPWAGEGGVDRFEAEAFIGLLEQSAPA